MTSYQRKLDKYTVIVDVNKRKSKRPMTVGKTKFREDMQRLLEERRLSQ
jgi:hypothetical protein